MRPDSSANLMPPSLLLPLQVSEEDFTLEQLNALSKEEETSGRRAKRQRT